MSSHRDETPIRPSPAAPDDDSRDDKSVCRCSLLLPIVVVAAMIVLILYQAGVFIPGRVRPGLTELFGPPPEAERWVAVEVVELPILYYSPGAIQSREEVSVAARIAARVTAVAVRAGDRVEAGDRLVSLDDVDLQARVAEVTQRLLSARARLSGAEEGVPSAIAEFELAQTEKTRTEQLLADGVSPQREMDLANRRFLQAQSAVEQARQAVISARAEVAAMEQSLNLAKANLSYATIASPLSGIVANRLVEPGDLASPGRPMVELFDPQNLRLEAPIRESLIKRVAIGLRVPFTVPALEREFIGEISEVVPLVDRGSRTFLIRVCVGADPELIPGMFGELRLELGREQAVVVPAAAIFRAGQLEYAVVADAAGGASRRLVRSVATADGRRRVLSGLQAGDRIAIDE